MARLFGTNGIRGVFPDDMSLGFVHDMTLSLATYFGGGPILVGYDGRDSSVVISKTVCSALNFAGLDCALAGLVPTPCLEYATKKLGFKGGIMVTASHNPPEYNGIKPAGPDGVEISRADELAVEDIYFEKSYRTAGTWGATSNDDRAVRTYLDGIRSHVYAGRLRKRNLSVVIDAGNGAQAVTAPELCRELGCNVTTINGEIDGSFSGRGSEPTPDNLRDLSRAVTDCGADLGVAFDGDGDRSLFCDDRGDVLTGDRSALLLSEFLLGSGPPHTVVTCVNSGSSIESVAERSGSQVIRTKVGSVEVSRRMLETGAFVGFEENGGFMYGPHNQVRDGAMTLALVLDMLSSGPETMSERARALPPSYTTKDKIKCTPQDAERIVATLAEQNPDADITDGIKITRGAGWIMVRPSGTEPIIRIYAEAESPDDLGSLMGEYLDKIRSILRPGRRD